MQLMAATLAFFLMNHVLVVSAAQEAQPSEVAEPAGPAETTKSGAADGKWSPALTGVRRPLYRLRVADTLEVHFTFAPEFDEAVTVQPDGFIPLKGLPELYVARLTVLEAEESVRKAYAGIMRDPQVTLVLRDFDRPYFIASGQVTRPGKYELREDLTVTEGIALAGGLNEQAKHSQVVLFRRVSEDLVESHVMDVKHMLSSKNLAEDVYLKPGDFIFVPQNTISKIRRYLPASNLGLYSTPTQF